MSDGRFAGRTVLITGAGSGIGLDVARRFAAEGANVALSGRSSAKLEDARASLRGSDDGGGGEGIVVAGDVSRAPDVRALVEQVMERFGRIDVLVNAAGVIRRDRKLCDVDEDEWDEHLAINLKGVFLSAKYAIPHMCRSGRGGAIVNIASQLAFVAAPKYPAYCAAKAGVVGLTRSMALDYAAEGIRANCVCPGLIDTPMAQVQRDDFAQIKDEIARKHPLGRIGQPKDVSGAVLYLASNEASWITGQSLIVDGGWTIQ